MVILKDSSVESFNTSVKEWVDDEKVRLGALAWLSFALAAYSLAGCLDHLVLEEIETIPSITSGSFNG